MSATKFKAKIQKLKFQLKKYKILQNSKPSLTSFFKNHPFIQRIKDSKYRKNKINETTRIITIIIAMYLAVVTRFRFSCEKILNFVYEWLRGNIINRWRREILRIHFAISKKNHFESGKFCEKFSIKFWDRTINDQIIKG